MAFSYTVVPVQFPCIPQVHTILRVFLCFSGILACLACSFVLGGAKRVVCDGSIADCRGNVRLAGVRAARRVHVVEGVLGK